MGKFKNATRKEFETVAPLEDVMGSLEERFLREVVEVHCDVDGAPLEAKLWWLIALVWWWLFCYVHSD